MAVAEQKADEPRSRNTSPGTGQTEDAPLLLDINRSALNGTTDPEPAWAFDPAFEGLSWWKKPSVKWLIPAFFVYALAFGGIMVPRLTLALTLVCREYLSHEAMLHPDLLSTPISIFGENPQCRVPEVQALSAKFVLYMSLTVGMLGAISSPKIGSLSDRYGRIWMLILTIFGGVLNETITIACASYPDTVNYRWLLLGAFFDGACGSFITAMAITHSYAADITAPHDRGVIFGYIQACLFGGIAVGPFIAAFITQGTGSPISVFYLAMSFHLAVLLYLALLVPESLSHPKQRLAQSSHTLTLSLASTRTLLQRLNPLQLFLPLRVLYPTGPHVTPALRRNLILLAVLSFTVFGVNMGAGPVMIFYSQYAFGWGDFEIQMFVGWTSATRVVSLMAILPLFNFLFRTLPARRAVRRGEVEGVVEGAAAKAEGTDRLDIHTITLSFLIELIEYLLFALAPTGLLFFTGGIIGSAAGIGSPILSSALSKHVSQHQMGELMGAIGLLHALGRVVCPAIFSLVYASTVAWWPGAVFVLLAACFAVGGVASVFVVPGVRRLGESEVPSGNETEEERENSSEQRFRDEVRREELDEEEYDHIRG